MASVLFNLLGGRAPMQFACRVCMSGWRQAKRIGGRATMQFATVPPRDVFCICMLECKVDWAQPYSIYFKYFFTISTM
jgi:hypothetical protein